MSVIAGTTHRFINAGPRSIAARRSIGVVCSCALLMGLQGCYSFIPTTNTALPEQTPVTVRLTLGGTVAMKDALGEGVAEVDGNVVRSTADSLVVAVEKMYTISRQSFPQTGTTAAIPRPYINTVKVRTFSRRRTVVTALSVLGAVLAAAAIATVSASGDGGGGVVPPPP